MKEVQKDMISVKINEKSNLVVGKLSQRFGMSKQSFISMVLGSLTTDDVLRLLAIHVREDENSEYDRQFQAENSGIKAPPKFEDEDENDYVEFELEDDDVPVFEV